MPWNDFQKISGKNLSSSSKKSNTYILKIIFQTEPNEFLIEFMTYFLVKQLHFEKKWAAIESHPKKYGKRQKSGSTRNSSFQKLSKAFDSNYNTITSKPLNYSKLNFKFVSNNCSIDRRSKSVMAGSSCIIRIAFIYRNGYLFYYRAEVERKFCYGLDLIGRLADKEDTNYNNCAVILTNEAVSSQIVYTRSKIFNLFRA